MGRGQEKQNMYPFLRLKINQLLLVVFYNRKTIKHSLTVCKKEQYCKSRNLKSKNSISLKNSLK